MSRAQTAAVALSVAGVGVSIYLTVLHFIGFVPACPVTGSINCEAVLSSPYAVILGTAVPTSASGIVWFAVSAVLWTRPFGRLQLAWSAAGVLTVLFLVFIEIVRVGAICLWCTAAHVLVVAIFLISLSSPGRGSG
ncbi:MAG TPA: vitamin K epoxide reductase family protein [Candidatus Dormibacteraeota bacterium]|nr:vitamin K epoxide reductase family protein [Candidatus Dormibacteraeota bacterium]